MGGKSKPDNSAVVNEQKAEAAAAAQKEADRQARLTTGLASIKSAFEGSPVMASSPYDWSSFKAPQTMPAAMSAYLAGTPGAVAPDFSKTGSVPAGYTAVQVPKRGSSTGTTAATKTNAGTASTGQYYGGAYASPTTSSAAATSGTSGGTGGGTEWALKGADGKIYYQGDALTTQTDTGATTGGFDDAFYNKYKQSVLDYYMPQVEDQYKKAQEQATYGLGRSGNLRSSAANTLVADLAKQNALNEAGVRSQADTASGDLRSQVASEENKAVSQLYATEDPEVAANTALASVRDISLKQPDLSPLSALFNVATIGGANIYKGYQGQQGLNSFNAATRRRSERSSRPVS